MISFFVPGIPATAGSKKGFYIEKIKKVVQTPASKKTKPWMNTVTFFARQEYKGPLLIGPLKLVIEFRLLRTQSHYGTGRNAGKVKPSAPTYSSVRPDLTKLTRALEDALAGITWRNDSQVCIQETRKIYVDRDPGAMVRISQIIEGKETTLFDSNSDKDARV